MEALEEKLRMTLIRQNVLESVEELDDFRNDYSEPLPDMLTGLHKALSNKGVENSSAFEYMTNDVFLESYQKIQDESSKNPILTSLVNMATS